MPVFTDPKNSSQTNSNTATFAPNQSGGNATLYSAPTVTNSGVSLSAGSSAQPNVGVGTGMCGLGQPFGPQGTFAPNFHPYGFGGMFPQYFEAGQRWPAWPSAYPFGTSGQFAGPVAFGAPASIQGQITASAGGQCQPGFPTTPQGQVPATNAGGQCLTDTPSAIQRQTSTHTGIQGPVATSGIGQGPITASPFGTYTGPFPSAQGQHPTLTGPVSGPSGNIFGQLC